jgi:tRNA pseudouridine55 synthase
MTPEILAREFSEGKVLLFNKPLYWTSFDLVRKVKYILGSKLGLKKIKIGHAGTLDPMATGLLIICTGKETRNIDLYQSGEKEYLATIRLGATTPSFDLETDIDRQYQFDHIKNEHVSEVLKDFTGEQLQYPPLFSAKSVGGARAYTHARKGRTIELNPGIVVIHSLHLVSFDLPYFEINIVCSKGTYIRSLARDIGNRLASGAHLVKLTRVRSGSFVIKDALNIDEFERNLILL